MSYLINKYILNRLNIAPLGNHRTKLKYSLYLLWALNIVIYLPCSQFASELTSYHILYKKCDYNTLKKFTCADIEIINYITPSDNYVLITMIRNYVLINDGGFVNEFNTRSPPCSSCFI